jgi:nitroreductase
MEMGCMSLSEAMLNRKSIRGYRPDPVPQDILRQVIGLAIESPSASNAQPWELAVLTGNPLEELNRITVDLWERGAPVNPDVAPADLFGDYMRRRKEVGKQVFQLLGIQREDHAARKEWSRRALRFFDAPAGVIICTDASLERSRTDFDLGILTEALCLAAMCFDLGTCIDQQAISYPEAIQQVTGLAESKRITAAVCIGYPDWEFPANKLESSREPVDVVASWHGF